MYASLIGTFDIPAPINYLGSNRTNPWLLPSHHEPEVPLSTMEVDYQDITQTTVDLIAVPLIVSEELEEVYLPAWAENSLHSTDCLDMVLPFDEAILEAMCG